VFLQKKKKMLRRTLRLNPRFDKNYDEVKYRGRREKLWPTDNPYKNRQEIFLDRFKVVGPETSPVWLSLGKQFRRRRVGRDRDWLDKRYYWRPIPHGIQNLYETELKRSGHCNKWAKPMTLFPTNREIGLQTSTPVFEKNIEKKYGAEWAAEVPFDWEYRVY
jgi:hypothetical protein